MRLVRPLLAVAVLAAVNSGAEARGTGYLFVSSEKDASILVVDPKTYQPVTTIPTNARPRHMQFSPDRTRIYAACGDGDSIDIIDVGKLALVDRIADVDDPEAFDFSADGKRLYISLEDDAKLGILDLAAYFEGREEKPELTVAERSPDDERGGEEEEDEEEEEEESEEGEDDRLLPGMSTIEVGAEPEGVLVHPNGKTVYVTSEVANIVHVVDTQIGEIAKNVLVGNRPRRFALTPDNKQLWVTNELSGSVSIVDAETNDVLASIEFRPKGFRREDVTPVGITMTADGKTVIVGLGRANHVAFVDVASRNIEDYVLVGTRAWNTTLTRDEKLLYVVNGLSDDISVIDTSSRRVIKSFPVGRVPYAVLVDD